MKISHDEMWSRRLIYKSDWEGERTSSKIQAFELYLQKTKTTMTLNSIWLSWVLITDDIFPCHIVHCVHVDL